jgi:hypothetical protein
LIAEVAERNGMTVFSSAQTLRLTPIDPQGSTNLSSATSHNADRAAAVAVVDAVDQRRQLLAPVVVGREQIRLMPGGGHQVEQHDADAERLRARDPLPQLLEAGDLCCT